MSENEREHDISYDGLEDLDADAAEQLERCVRPENATRRVLYPFGDSFGIQGEYTAVCSAMVAYPMVLDALIVPRMYARCFSVSQITIGFEQMFRANPPVPLVCIDLSDHRDSIIFWFPEPMPVYPGLQLAIEIRNNLPNVTMKFAAYWLGRIAPQRPSAYR